MFYSFEYFEDEKTFIDQASILGSSIDSLLKRKIDFSKTSQKQIQGKLNYFQKDAPPERMSVNQYDSTDNINVTNVRGNFILKNS